MLYDTLLIFPYIDFTQNSYKTYIKAYTKTFKKKIIFPLRDYACYNIYFN